MAVLRILTRRSKDDAQAQENSLGVQRAVCERFAERLRTEQGIFWTSRKLYEDDGVAGDDFAGRTELNRLLAEVKKGDIVVCRDHTRLGRAMLNTAVIVQQLTTERGARLFYADSGQEVTTENSLKLLMVVLQGYSSHAEKEANQTRTRDALREKVRRGEIAGGRCFGYRNVQRPVSNGRKAVMNTVAEIDEEQAEVVRLIYRLYVAEEWGLKKIAHHLNDKRILSPHAGRRGTGSWAPSSVRCVLTNERYRGVYIHGRVERKRENRKRIAIKVDDPSKIIRVDRPEWRIVDDGLWYGAQDRMREQGPRTNRPGPSSKYALSGIGRCVVCGGGIGVRRTRASMAERVPAYGCVRHYQRGNSVCGVATLQPAEEVEGLLAAFIQQRILTPSLVAKVITEIRGEVERQLATPADTRAVENELAQVRAEQKRLAQAVAISDDIPELVGELRKRNERIRNLEAELRAAQRLPEQVRDLMKRAEASAREKVRDLRTALRDRETAREVFLALFPDGLTFEAVEARKGQRRVFRVRGTAKLAAYNLKSDPTGTRTRDFGVRGQRPNR